MSAEDRLRRLLAMVPWIVARDGPTTAEVCARFGCSEAELLEDLDLLFLCGLHPYTPDMLIDVDVADGRVWVRYAEYFRRPLRLTPAEALALVAAGRTLLAAPGADPEGPLARGLAKLATALGIDEDESLEVSLGPAAPDVLATLRDAAALRQQADIEYYSFGRDTWTRRVVDPYAVFTAEGQWYLAGWCHQAGDERLFRVDRVRAVRVLETTFDAPPRPPELTVYHPRPGDERVLLSLDPSARWVVEQYPVESVDEQDDGSLLVRLAASERPWLERLLLRLGPAARVVEGDESVARDAACRVLARYRDGAALR